MQNIPVISPLLTTNTTTMPTNTSDTTPTASVPTPPIQQKTYSVRGYGVNDNDLNTLRNTMFAEISNRSPEKQMLEGQVIANTALNRMGQSKTPTSLSGVLTARNQYQGYGSPEYERIANGQTGPADAQKLSSIDAVINKIKSGNLTDNTGGKVYYSHDKQGRIWLADGNLYK